MDATEPGMHLDWNRARLASLLIDARSAANGIASETLHLPEGTVQAMIVCVTAPDHIRSLEKALRVSIDDERVDCHAETMMDVVHRAQKTGGIACLSVHENGSRAMVVCAESLRYLRVLEYLVPTPSGSAAR